ncbi:mannose-6-phosphate isomerase, class I [Propioniferax innocua]|uniref:mannose-6-phosphate isomerase n=1 Tax=Propioniferax innocua TaxID=1753 RepID=A0A542ZCA3_9ACTN|nr:mannose-6-phosphate isomerase, class I [Propioniferax innocua]TQL57964.1 mannose-6-phosphate isomerase type 1 [Propioniferax innocua]
MQRITGTRQHYPWGSTDGIPRVLGEEPTRTPLAEYWFGAHPKAPATLTGGMTLDAHLSQNPDQLGDSGRAEYGDVLPFLLKLLSARTALSIQAHPSRQQAEAGFARENAAGLATDAPNRNYRDDWPKPEAVVALTEFDALCGFRDPTRTQHLFAELGVDATELIVQPLTDGDGIARVFLGILDLGAEAADLIDHVVAAAKDRLDAGIEPGEFANFCDTAITTADDFPGDPGVLAALLLNRVRLNPGEGLALEAGNVHAYLRGTAIEIMSNSDNVLRGGLTTKHIDIDELARVVDFRHQDVDVVTWQPAGAGVWRFPAPFGEFALWRVSETALPAEPSPRIAVSLGEAALVSPDGPLTLGPGQAAFLSAGEPVTVRGEVIVASHGL